MTSETRFDVHTLRSLDDSIGGPARDAAAAGKRTADATESSDARLVILANQLVDVNTALGVLHADLVALTTAVGLLATAAAQATGNASLGTLVTDTAAIKASAANLKANGGATGIIATLT